MRITHGQKVALVVSLIIVISGWWLFFRASSAQAGLPVVDYPQLVQWLKQSVEKLKEVQWKKVATQSLQSAAERYLNRIAYEAANYLAAGGPGGTSLVRRQHFGRMLRDTSERALGDFVQTLSNESGLNDLGLNLCDPSASLKLSLVLPILDEAAPPRQLDCDISQIKKNWEDFARTAGVSWSTRDVAGFSTGLATRQVCASVHAAGTVEYLLTGAGDTIECTSNFDCLGTSSNVSSGTVDPLAQPSGQYSCVTEHTGGGVPWLSLTANQTVEEKLKTFNDLLSPQQSNLGAWVKLVGKQDDLKRAALEAEKLALSNCDGSLIDQTANVDKDLVIRTCEEIRDLKDKTGAASAEETVLRLFSKGETGLFLNAARIFSSTLISKMLKKYIQGGSFSLSQINKGANLSEVRENIIQKLRGGAVSPTDFVGNDVTSLLADTKRPVFRAVADYDYLTAMTICPDNRNQVELENCTMDENFAEAIRDKRTVAQALEAGQLRGELGIISNLNTSLNSDPFCIRSGYCHSNIVRMRKYRILPIGWEIAASLSPIDKPVSLADVVNCFENGPQCPLDPEVNVYYHLIDPNWVLKAPEAECRSLVYGPKLVDVDVNERQQYCADPTSCLMEDSEGNCIGGFGYCTKEKNTWRFAGTECPAQFAGCRTFTREADQRELSVLQSTLDTCDATQVGCKWYSVSQDNIGSAQEPVYAWNPNDRIYLNRNAEECAAEFAGCSEYISVITSGVNLVPNGDFEYFTAHTATNYSDPAWIDDANFDSFDGWQGGATAYTTRENAFLGTVGLHLEGPGVYSTRLNAGPVADRTFTLSWYGKSNTTGECTADVSIATLSAPAQNTTVTYTNAWHQYELATTFDVANPDTTVLITFDASCAGAGGPYDLFIDAVKFELNSASTGFTSYGEGGAVYLKSQFQCTKDDVGCDLYTPVDGGVGIPGKVDSRDSCPAECVGYQTYMQLVSKFDVMESPATLPATTYHDFIATTALSCPAQEVDCEEFTNVEEVEQGGEGREYYTFVRQCVGDALGTTYYTLEGSDTAGYQVRTWRLLPSNLNFGGSAASDFPDSSPAGGIPPCSNIAANGTTCLDNAGSGNRANTTCAASQLDVNLDCREYFDINGRPHYLLQSRVIASSDECIQLRRSKTGVVFNALQSESRSCPAQYNGCREYRGSQANNVRTLLSSNFESGIIEPWDTAAASITSEAVTTGGRSMTNQTSGGLTNSIPWKGSAMQLQTGREVYVSFWMKNTQPTRLMFQVDPLNPAVSLSVDVSVATDWQVYNLGPLYLNADVQSSPIITIQPIGGGPQPQVFLDNIVFQESLSNVFVVANSWKTPASCDEPVPGAMLGCRSYENLAGQVVNLKSFSKLCSDSVVGCQAFISTHNSTNPFQTIHNEDDPAEMIVPQDSIQYLVFNEQNRCFEQYKGCALVGEPDLNRDLDENHPQYIRGYKLKYLLNDPDRYDEILCTAEGLFCEEYADSAGASFYFKDPGNRRCVYRTNQNVQGALFTGWFQRDSLTSGIPKGCSDDNVLPYEDSDFELISALNYQFDGWAGECSAQYDRCTDFKDPLDTQGDNALTNADFSDGINGWQLTGPGAWGNSDPARFSAGLGYAVSRVSPKGIVEAYQVVRDIDDTDIFAFSVEANVRSMPPTPEAGVQTFARCFWDSPMDTDYCRGGAGQYDYSRTCDQGCSSGYSCSTPLQKYSANYCESAGDSTNLPCLTNFDCTDSTRLGLGAGYTCQSRANANNADRDHYKDYNASADPKRVGTWQTLSQIVDLGFDGKSKQLVECRYTLSHHTGRVDTTNNPAALCSNPSTALGTPACRDTYCIDAAGNTDNPAVTCNNTAGEACPAGYTCGGPSEVWWRNPTFKEARSYYYINDESIDDASCQGQVGKRDGCFLFVDTSQRQSKLYDTFATYEKSANNNGGLVSPVSCSPSDPACQNDANRIIKVERDRECVEWLTCRSATEVFDSTTNSYRQVCDQVGTCNEYQEGGSVLSCGNWVAPSKQRLEYASYINRSVDFDAADYAGYSVYEHYPVGTLEIVDVSINEDGDGPDGRNADYRLVRTIDACDSAANYGDPCGPENPLAPGDFLGSCFTPNKCVVGIDGSKFSRESDFVITPSTRGWAERDSPFPYSVIESDTGRERRVKFGFQQSNICESNTQSCEFRYYKFQYGGTGGGVTRYYSADIRLTGGEIPNCICVGGLRDDQACLADDIGGKEECVGGVCRDVPDGKLSIEERCPDAGSPVYLRRTESYINWPGYCIEQDARANVNASVDENACLTWLPVDNSPTGFDFFNQNREAGYSYKVPAYYCLEVGLFEERKDYEVGWLCNGDCNNSVNQDPSSYYMVESSRHRRSGCGWNDDPQLCIAKVIGGPGIYSYNGNTVFHEQSPDASCIALAQSVDERGENAAMTNLFWSGKDYQVTGVGYKIGQDDLAFGSAVPQTIGIVEDDQLQIQPQQVVPRAGSPYACSSSAASCALFDGDSGDVVAVQGWKKNPPFAGNETYVTGLTRLKEIFKKIFYVAKWAPGKKCNYYVCGETSAGGESSYFGGMECDPGSANACNQQLNVTSCADIANTCVNSVFNSPTGGDSLYRGCSSCLVGFVSEQAPQKRCQSANVFTTQTACDAAIIDSAVGTCSSYPGYSCQETATGSGQWRCFSPNRFDGNDCKIPHDPVTGNLLPQYITCQLNLAGQKTCHYDGEDTTILCATETECEASGGDLHSSNISAYCADSVDEGAHDPGLATWDICVGQPFTLINNGYVFDGDPVRCGPGETFVNGLGVTLTGSTICTNNGECRPASNVLDANNVPFCQYLPTGYLPLCNSSLQSCAGVPSERILDANAFPLDATASSTPSFSPYILPVVCDANGVNCHMTTRSQYPNPVSLDDITIPPSPVVFPDNTAPFPDLGFSINNQVTDQPQLEGHQNFIASLKFYMAADKNHIPIRYIDIDWGDGSRQSRVGYYKNHLEECSTSLPGPATAQQELLEYAGDSQACRETFRSYVHVYAYTPGIICAQCTGGGPAIACGKDSDCPVGESCSVNIIPNASCFRPKVSIQDNWGWCTNSVYGQVGLGCRDPLVLNTTHGWNHAVPVTPPEPANADQSYIKFPGVIKVYQH